MSKGRQGTFDRGPSHPTALSRRGVLKGAAAAAGAAAGNGLIGAPMVWAQELKGIELRHIGVSYSVVKEIGDQASKDLGFKVSTQNLDTSAAITRFITQPLSVDIPDMEGWQTKVAVPRGILWPAARRRLQHPGYSLRSQGGVYQYRSDRRLSRCWSSRSHLCP